MSPCDIPGQDSEAVRLAIVGTGPWPGHDWYCMTLAGMQRMPGIPRFLPTYLTAFLHNLKEPAQPSPALCPPPRSVSHQFGLKTRYQSVHQLRLKFRARVCRARWAGRHHQQLASSMTQSMAAGLGLDNTTEELFAVQNTDQQCAVF